MTPRRALLATIALLLVVAVVAELRYRVGFVAPESASATSFSGARARAVLARILGDGAPHPTGSAEAAKVRERIAAELTRLGLAPEVRTAKACGRYGTCAVVHDLVARIRGTASTGAVVLAAHSDSVPAGPGASDDGAGVASVIEAARAILSGPPPRNDVVLLVTDGEELGLLGAESFVHDPVASQGVRAVVNVEARGTCGPAALFQTSKNGGWLVTTFARVAPRPVGSSLYPWVYEKMPNDTDLTVFLGRGWHGANFAFSGCAERYHTSKDDLAHAHPGSLQHQGESALSLARALADADLRAAPEGDVVWFDVLAAFVVRWPARVTILLAGLASLLALVAAVRVRVRPTQLLLGAAAALATIVFAAIAGLLAWAPARLLGALPVPWIAHPGPILVALGGAPVVSLLLVAAIARRRLSLEGAWLGGVATLSLLSIVVSWVAPAPAYLLVAPALSVAVAAAISAFVPRAREIAIGVSSVLSLLVHALVLRSLYPGLGIGVGPAISALAGLTLLPLLPLLWAIPEERRVRFATIAAAGVAVAAVVACAMPPFSAEAPRRVNVVYHRDETRASLVVDATFGGMPWGDVPKSMRDALGPSAHDALASPWASHFAVVADAPLEAIPLPEAEVLSRKVELGVVRVRVRLRSPRGARSIRLVALPGSTLVHVDVEGGLPRARALTRGLPAGFRGWAIDGVPSEGIEITAARVSDAPSIVHLVDESGGLPAAAKAVVDARPTDASASQEGDRTIASRKIEI